MFSRKKKEAKKEKESSKKDSKRESKADAESAAALKNGPPVPDYLPPQMEAKPAEVTIYVNGKTIKCPPTYTILKACRENGIKVPTLCHHPSLQPTGRCAVCVVHIEGRNPPLQQACKTHVEQDMIVTTNSPEVLYQSQINLREFLGMHSLNELPDTSEIEDLMKFVDQGAVVREEHNQHRYAIVRNQELCISCTRCVRACSGVQNMNILNIDPDRPLQPISFEGDLPLYATNCIACGQCTSVCPTGAVSARNDVRVVLEQLRKAGDERKIMLIQTAPAARLSVGEVFGDDPPKSPMKTVAALHAMGFDYVFDTTFAADVTAQLEAEELVERIKADGPWPMFTSCCPAWILLVEKKYPHLRDYVSRCKSPMMMMGTIIRCWMKKRNIPRNRYFSVALMPCTAKKEEILRPDLKDPDGNYDVDVVLTAREMGELVKAMNIDWKALPGNHSTAYDPPFNVSSGAGALFPVGGGVTEAALRVAYGLFTKEIPRDPERCLYEQIRKTPKQIGEWISSEVQVTPDRRHKRPIEAQVINGTRAIQQFLEDVHLDTPDGSWTQKGSAFVECMACPGGCVGGGGQPHSLADDIVARRRAAVHVIDRDCKLVSSTETMKDFSYEETCGIKSEETFRELMECEPPMLDEFADIRSKSASRNGNKRASRNGSKRGSKGSTASGSCRTFSGGANYLGNLTILYGSQAGFTASFSKHLFSMLDHNLPDDVTVHSMDHFNYDLLKTCETVVLLTSTWESDIGLMPQNAVRFWNWLKALPLDTLNSIFSRIKFAVCGFGSQKYRYFCGFAIELHQMFLRLGATPFMDLIKIDVDKPDRGKKSFTRWSKSLLSLLQTPVIPDPKYLLVPSITPGGKSAPLSCPRGYNIGTITAVMPYKKIPGAEDCYFCEFSTGKLQMEPLPEQYIYVYPSNSPSQVEYIVNLLYPGMLNTPISILESQKKGGANNKETSMTFPSHLTVRQLFERYLDLSRRPSVWFVQQMESLVEESQSTLRDLLEDPDAFENWAKDKDYFQVLKMYKDVMPSIEVLITMLPKMMPRCYTPLHQEQTHGNFLSFMFKKYAGGLCSNYLAGLKRGEKIVFTLGTSEFRRPNDELMQPFYHAMGTGSGSTSSQTLVPSKMVPYDKFPLVVGTPCLFQNLDRKPAVDEQVFEGFDIANTQKDKYRFTIANQETSKYRLTFEPSSGVIKSRYSVRVKATITVFCTCTVNAKAIISAEALSKKKDEEGVVSVAIPVMVETKLSPKIDYDEIKFIEEIGSGSFGTVSRGEWRGQDVAVKIVKGNHMKSDDFRNECKMLQELRCQYIINFVGYSILPDKCALLTEFMELGSLSKYIHDDLSEDYRAKVALDVAKGMSFLHNCGLMHRDLKPQNILVVSLVPSQQVVVKIADFGVSKELPASGVAAFSATASTRGMSGSKRLTGGVGTPIYMAPEVLDGEKYTTSADVYSFAMVLLELYSGEEPYSSDKFKTPMQIAQFVRAGNRLEIPKTIPDEIVELITKCWDKTPSARPNFEYCVDNLTNFYALYTSGARTAGAKGKKHHDHKGKDKKDKKDKNSKKAKKGKEATDDTSTTKTDDKDRRKKKVFDESGAGTQMADDDSSSSSSGAF